MHHNAFTVGKSPGGMLRVWMVLFGFGFTSLLFAHDPGLSVATARLDPAGLKIHLALSPADAGCLVPIDANHDGNLSPAELAAAQSQLEKSARVAFEVKQDGQSINATKVKFQLEKSGALQFDVSYPALAAGELRISSGIIGRLPRGHRQFVSIRDEENKLLGEAMLAAARDSVQVTLAKEISPPAAQHSFRDFLRLGIGHIATGYDHMLFLLGLLIVGGSFKSALKIITSFTVAHSLTLALATMNLINIPPDIIEPLIAVSIIYVGVENILRRDMDQRWLLAFGFGLVHGCGFASALRELGVGANGTSLVGPLFSFNLGVEIAQLTLAALLLPVIWKLRERPQFTLRLVPAGSCLIALAGAWWLLQRTLL